MIDVCSSVEAALAQEDWLADVAVYRTGTGTSSLGILILSIRIMKGGRLCVVNHENSLQSR